MKLPETISHNVMADGVSGLKWCDTLLGVLSGDIAIFFPGMLCRVVLCVSVMVIVLWGITGEVWVRTRPVHKEKENVSHAPLRVFVSNAQTHSN